MNPNKMDLKAKFSTLWIVVMINVAMADIFGFMLDLMAGGPATEFQPDQVTMLVFAIIMEIPILMIFLSRILKYKVNRWANIIAGVITIAFVILGGSAELHYYFFAAVEIACMLLIIQDAWKWENLEV
ncbi:MAG: DUF6326 family protein [Anaerolineales bacterium]